MPSSFPPERWQDVEDLLDAVIPMKPEARKAHIDAVCAEDPELREEVLHLLEFEDQAEAAFEGTKTNLMVTLLESYGEHEIRTIGPYRLVREVGRGGMGTVYLAERDDVGKQAALKIVRGGLASPDIKRRFLFERRLLARLDHPNIARLLDAGVAEDETPYFVMEYVEGEPITAYCDRCKSGIDARLALFQTVCEAVQYAHQHLIVHRDLKPSNILVGETEDGRPKVKLLDFGIAKLLQENEEAEAFTRTGLQVMTPEYAAPEQVRSEPVTTATDVYTLGLLLYQLLTGQHPYRVKGAPREISRIILDTTPKKPSTAVLEASSTAEGERSITVERATSVEQLRRRLRGDLDVICLKALEKEPERRYQSAEQLLEDLKRHLSGQPVAARAPTVGYRLQKFVHRHRWQVAGASLAVLMLVSFAIAMTLQQAETAQARDRAQAALARSEAVTDFLTGLFEVNDPFGEGGDTLTAYDLLARGVERAEAFSEDREVQAQVLHTIGVVYERLEQYAQAESLLSRALTLRRETLGEEHPDVATSLNQLAWLLRKKGDYDAAEPFLREALAMRLKLLGEEHLDVATNLNDLATLLNDKGDYDSAEPLFREALDMRQELLGEEDWMTAVSTANLALFLWYKGDFDEAEPLSRKALAMQKKIWGEEHPEVVSATSNLALILEDKGELAIAESLFRQGMAIDRKLLGDAHPYVANSLQHIARTVRQMGDLATPESLLQEALSIRRIAFGERHPQVAINLYEMAMLYRDRGDSKTADSLFRKALTVQRELLGNEHPHVAASLTGLAGLLRETGNYAPAEPMLRTALEIRRKFPNHPDAAETILELARLLVESRNAFTEAEPLYEEALRILLDSFDEEHFLVRQTYEELVRFYEAWGKPERAAHYKDF